MNGRLSEEIAALAKLSGPALRARYAELFGDATRVGNRAWLVRRIAWRLQALSPSGEKATAYAPSRGLRRWTFRGSRNETSLLPGALAMKSLFFFLLAAHFGALVESALAFCSRALGIGFPMEYFAARGVRWFPTEGGSPCFAGRWRSFSFSVC